MTTKTDPKKQKRKPLPKLASPSYSLVFSTSEALEQHALRFDAEAKRNVALSDGVSTVFWGEVFFFVLGHTQRPSYQDDMFFAIPQKKVGCCGFLCLACFEECFGFCGGNQTPVSLRSVAAFCFERSDETTPLGDERQPEADESRQALESLRRRVFPLGGEGGQRSVR